MHVSLLPREVQAIIGEVGPETLGALRLLQSIGFADSGKVDPFDGGPHWEVATDEISLVREAQWCRAEDGRRRREPASPASSRGSASSRAEPAAATRRTRGFARSGPTCVIARPSELVTTVGDEPRTLPDDWGQDLAGDWAVPAPGRARACRDRLAAQITMPAKDLAALRLPAGDEQVLVALRPQQRVAV